MHILEKIGLALVIIALCIFTYSLNLGTYKLSPESLQISNEYHKKEVLQIATETELLNSVYSSKASFIRDFKNTLKKASAKLNEKPIPEGVSEWDFKLGDWTYKDYTMYTVKHSTKGLIVDYSWLFLFLTFGLGALGVLIHSIPKYLSLPGIKNNQIYQSAMTRGLTLSTRSIALSLTIVGVLVYGIFYLKGNFIWTLLTLLVMGLISYLVLYRDGEKANNPTRSASPTHLGWLGLLTGMYLIGFYVLLYWSPEYITNWMLICDPVSKSLSGNQASQWFVYGLLYTIVMLVMGVRMIGKYRHNRYQIIRTISVIFFQTAFAFIIPEILVRLNQPYYDFKNIWPLDYDFFFDWNLNTLMNSGGLGIFMLVWGIVLIVIGVPLITYFFGKRWYCSWVCGCGGLAETLGDPYRQLSDKSLRAWKFERYIIHGVMVFAVAMTGLVLFTYFTGSRNVLFLSSDTVRSWYGFLIGSAFAGVVGTGFYPLMGNRVWCRFGCPLAGYLGLVQRFKSRFRITTNGGQCISCGNCSTYCEMGIDVRAYAQRGQNIVRSSCVGCGVCAAVCPRGVLRLENGSADIENRTTELKTIHITEDQIRLLS